jgi:hypothetical protein
MGRKKQFLRDKNGNLVLDEDGNPVVEAQGMAPDWKASAWRLERRNPKQWGRLQKISGPDGDGPVEVAQPQIIINIPGNGRDNK